MSILSKFYANLMSIPCQNAMKKSIWYEGIERTRARYIVLAPGHVNSPKSDFLDEMLSTRKFSPRKFFGASTYGILTHSRFRKCSQFGWASFRFKVTAAQNAESDRTKNKKVFIFHNTEFASRQISKRGSTSATRNSALKTPYPPLP